MTLDSVPLRRGQELKVQLMTAAGTECGKLGRREEEGGPGLKADGVRYSTRSSRRNRRAGRNMGIGLRVASSPPTTKAATPSTIQMSCSISAA